MSSKRSRNRRWMQEIGLLKPLMEQSMMKTDGGAEYPKEAYAHVGDPEKPSTWKLRLWETPDKKVTLAQLGRAAAACSSGGFRGNKVQLSADEMKAAKSKIRAAYRKLGKTGDEIPASVREQLVAAEMLTQYLREGKPLLAWRYERGELLEVYADIAGSVEELTNKISQAVDNNASSFGVTGAEPYERAWVEAVVPTSLPSSGTVIVRGPDESYTADWAVNDAGDIELSNIAPVEIQVKTKAAETAELTETWRAPVRILAEKESGPKDNPDHLMTVECILGVADKPTKNGRVYPKGLFEKLVAECEAGTDRSKRWLAEADHPNDGHARVTATISTPWRNLRLDDDGRLLGETDIIDTTLGTDVQKLIRNGVPVGVSSRTFATTKTEVRNGQTLEVVDETSAFEHWGGWDTVLGAAADEAGVTNYSEMESPTASNSSDDVSPDDITEALEKMTVQELVSSVTEGVKEALKPLMESKTEPQKTEEKTEPAKPAEGDVLAKVDEAMKAVNALTAKMEAADKKAEEEAKAKVTTEALAGAVKAVMEKDEVKAWPEPARKLMESSLKDVKDPEQLAPTFERVTRNLQEVGLIVIGGKPGIGKVALVNDGSGTQDSVKERAKLYQLGILPKEHLPSTIDEAVSLMAEGIPDNGLRTTQMSEDEIKAQFGERLPFPGYHPGNELHQFQLLLRNVMMFEDMKYLRGHLKGLSEWTGTAAIAQTTPFILPMIRQVWMRLIARELCSVQPMNKSTGIVHFLNFLSDPGGANFATPGAVASDYAQYVSEQDYIPEVRLTLTHADITMDTKKLHAEWSTEVRQNLQFDHGLNIAAEMVNFMADEIAREINALLLNDMRLTADPNGVITAGNTNYGTALPAAGYTNLSDWYPEIYTAVLQSDALVRAQRRARTNWMVAGPNALIRLTRIPQFQAATQDPESRDWEVGIHRVGTIEGNPNYNLYGADADIMPTNTILLGRRGTEWPDAGEVYCPWIPLYTAPMWIDPRTFCEHEAVMSRFGYRKVVGNMFSTVTVLPGVAGVPF